MKSRRKKEQKCGGIHIGTSGFQYDAWKGVFYPEKISKAKMLPYYADRFDTTEINYTFRHFPSERTLTNWSASTPEHFQFSLKAPEKITHRAKLRNCARTLLEFHRAVSGLGKKLGVVLFQLSPKFRADVPLLTDFLAEIPKGFRTAFEFRHPSWFTDSVFAALRSRNSALCIAETDDLKTPIQITADYAYFRLRREDYSSKDIAKWAKQILSVSGASHSFVYFKHEETGIGTKFAKSLIKLTGSRL